MNKPLHVEAENGNAFARASAGTCRFLPAPASPLIGFSRDAHRYTLVCGRDEAIAAWVKARAPWITHFGDCTAIGVMREKHIIAGVVFYNFIANVPAIDIAIAADVGNWAQKGVLAGLFHYPFRQLQCQRIGTTAREDQPEGIEFLKALAFVEEGRHRRSYPDGGTGVSFGMIRDECPWLVAANGD